MKLIALTAAGLVAATALTPIPAEAQRYGYDNGHRDGYRSDDRHDRRRHSSHGWQSSRSWHGNRGHSYTRCHYVRGYYGRQRQCYRVYR